MKQKQIETWSIETAIRRRYGRREEKHQKELLHCGEHHDFLAQLPPSEPRNREVAAAFDSNLLAFYTTFVSQREILSKGIRAYLRLPVIDCRYVYPEEFILCVLHVDWDIVSS